MDARNSQFLQRTATNSSGSLQLKSPVSLGAGDFGLYTLAPLGLEGVLMGLLGGSLPRWVSCDCLGAAWSSERLALALAPVCWRSCGGSLPWWEFAPARACLGVACPGGCPAIAMALLGLASALRLPWRRLVWRVSCVCLGAVWPSERLALALAPVCLASCEVLACDSYLVRQGRGLPYKTGSVKDWFGKTRFSRTNWIRRRISLAQ